MSESHSSDKERSESHSTNGRGAKARIMRSFRRLASFSRQFIKNFNSIIAPMIEVIKCTSFRMTPKSQIAFEEIKDKLTRGPVLALPCFKKV